MFDNVKTEKQGSFLELNLQKIKIARLTSKWITCKI